VQNTELLVIGAGPFGLSVAAHAKHCGMSITVVGEPMGFWKHYMPAGMLLRSGLDWHLDAAEVHTLVSFIEEKHLPLRAAEPIPVEIDHWPQGGRRHPRLRAAPGHVAEIGRAIDQRRQSFSKSATYDSSRRGWASVAARGCAGCTPAWRRLRVAVCQRWLRCSGARRWRDVSPHSILHRRPPSYRASHSQ
jgi:cation diffusion facilitator CzcD-associated flavoprotein CzcO